MPTILSWPGKLRPRQVSHQPGDHAWTGPRRSSSSPAREPDPASRSTASASSTTCSSGDGRARARPVLADARRARAAARQPEVRAARPTGADRLYDLAADVREQANLARNRPAELAALRARVGGDRRDAPALLRGLPSSSAMTRTPLDDLRAAVQAAAGELRANGAADRLSLERPKKAGFGDYSTNAAMLLAPVLGEPPRAIAEKLGASLQQSLGDRVEKVEVAGPGLPQPVPVRRLVPRGRATACSPPATASAPATAVGRVQVEFVSANPTGPLTAASGRHAAFGDALARILELAGDTVEREYYFNDGGGQVRPARRVDPGPRPRRGAAGGRLPGRVRRRGRRADPGRGGDVARRARREGRRAAHGGHPRDAGALPRHVRPLVPRALALRGLAQRWDERASEAARRRPRLRERGRAVAAHDRARRRREGPRRSCAPPASRPTSPPTSPTTGTSSHRGFDRSINVLGADHHGYVVRLKAIIAAAGADPDRLDGPAAPVRARRRGRRARVDVQAARRLRHARAS